MQLSSFFFFISFLTVFSANAQIIKVLPYLQDVRPHSGYILWETDHNEESIVEWGLTEALGSSATGAAYTSEGESLIHEVQLTGLERFTRYYYRVKTGAAVSEIYHFKTPPFAADQESFRMVAMSDMQRDGSLPDKFRETVEEGVLDYFAENYEGDLTDNLAMVLVPGDLVVTGTNYAQWQNHFFNPAEDLLTRVPLYPVLGNHENNSEYYFKYFKMPENGTEGFEEHWWYKDYGNVRIIGLNSNGGFAGETQLNWLDETLTATCTADSVDFVLAQLHHPHKSELWTPGESNFTGEVIQRLEQFSTDCQKPSLHFFGHTHGYSRGQSRDHKHLWVNVATAGGAIDNWGEFPNFDYDEFSVSQDEYGFVILEISNTENPFLTVKRIGRGDQDAIEDNILRDSVVIRLTPAEVTAPQPLAPIDTEIVPECVVLAASPFAAPNAAAQHGQSHWQVSFGQNNFDNPTVESWKNFENFYFDVDTQQEDDLTDEIIEGLLPDATYWWRVRYRDREMNWSDWSVPVSFTTGNSIALPNLLLNPGAEEGLVNWEITEGVVESLVSEECAGIPTHGGERYFAVGGLCEHSAVGRLEQSIDISALADSTDAGGYQAEFGGYLSNFSGSDLPEMWLVFLDADDNEIGMSSVLSTLNSNWTLVSAQTEIPPLTRTVRCVLQGTRNAGTDNDSYFDDLFLRIGTGEGCGMITGVRRVNIPVSELRVVPNPTNGITEIILPPGSGQNLRLYAADTAGRKVNLSFVKSENGLRVDCGDLPAGTYMFVLREGKIIRGTGKITVLPK